jgi:hypothetical protein
MDSISDMREGSISSSPERYNIFKRVKKRAKRSSSSGVYSSFEGNILFGKANGSFNRHLSISLHLRDFTANSGFDLQKD